LATLTEEELVDGPWVFSNQINQLGTLEFAEGGVINNFNSLNEKTWQFNSLGNL